MKRIIATTFALGLAFNAGLFTSVMLTPKHEVQTFTTADIAASGLQLLAHGTDGGFMMIGDGKTAIVLIPAGPDRFEIVASTGALTLAKNWVIAISRSLGICA